MYIWNYLKVIVHIEAPAPESSYLLESDFKGLVIRELIEHVPACVQIQF